MIETDRQCHSETDDCFLGNDKKQIIWICQFHFILVLGMYICVLTTLFCKQCREDSQRKGSSKQKTSFLNKREVF